MRTVEINATKYPVRLSHRARIEFERLSGKAVYDATTLEDATLLLYCGIKSGAKSSGLAFDMKFEEFIDYCDLHPEIVEAEDEDNKGGDDEKKSRSHTT